VLTVYRRDGCHLCDAAEEALGPVARELGLLVEQVDIESDQELLKRYMFEIPVIALNGEEIAKAPMSARALAAAVREAMGRSTPDGKG
jgi:glutaredoxin